MRVGHRLCDRRTCGINNVDYRSASVNRLRRSLFPNCIPPVNKDLIPDDTLIVVFTQYMG